MRLGLHLVNFDADGGPAALAPLLASVGAAVEDAGFDNLSVMDHYLQLEFMGPPTISMLEGYTTLGFLAAHTSTVDLQLLVTGITYRHPGLLAKVVATLDVLSGGRAVLGLGAAWYEREHRALGVEYPPLAERFERLEETLQVVRQMWSADDGPYAGEHYQLAETICSPQPLRPVPVMLGGSGEQKTLRLVARYADACNLFANAELGPAGIEHKLAVLSRHCTEVGRSYDDIAKTILWTGDCDPHRFVEAMRPYADLGVSEVHVMRLGPDPVTLVEALAPRVDAVHGL
ncbi:MAG: class F420-dependent oxidoreductase [Marmoricola sp.]|nr:class F420-dependent oxidoreductase [Marmoricola sp.]